MRIDDLEKTIKDFIESDNERAILINAKWGWGKTTQLRKAISNLKKQKVKNINYCSIFGARSVSDIRVCYNKILAGISQATKMVLKLGTATTSLIPYAGQYVENGLNNILNDVKDPKVLKKNCIFVFDDVERVSNAFSYLEFFGFINTLFSTGSRVICLSSPDNIEDENKKKEFKEFSEKVFDRVLEVDVKPIDIARQIIKQKCEIDFDEAVFENFDGNLRKVNKAASLYSKLKKYALKKELLLFSMFSEEEVFEATLSCINVMFPKKSMAPVFADSTEGGLKRAQYEDYKSKFGNYGDAMYKETRLEDYEPKNRAVYYRDLIEAIFLFYAFNNTSELDTYKRKSQEQDFLEQYYFFLNDSDRARYIRELISYISKAKTFKEINKTIFKTSLSLLILPDSIISDEEKEKIKDKLISLACEDDDTITEIEHVILFEDDTKAKTFYRSLLSEINDHVLRKSQENIVATFVGMMDEGDDEGMRKMLYEAYHAPSVLSQKYKNLISHIETHGYCFPDFRCSISSEQWYCADLIVKLIAKFGDKNRMKDYLETRIKENGDSPSIKEKYRALLGRIG